ncbi:hypothetical protein ACIP4S_22475 [Streptomyces chartreusis]|uniref:hypothetical protein n=1 Tax=Streptomyces chartreusis TaxID=1969 RepID=UPI00381F605C
MPPLSPRMLRTYGPWMRRRAPVLEVVYPVERDLHLDGRGLLLVPSCFARSPVALADTALPPPLVHPARPRTSRTRRRSPRPAKRAGPGCSLSSASEHPAVLRGAGLISSVRQSNAVRHALPPLGSALLREADGDR